MDHTACDPLFLVSFIGRNVFRGHPCYSLYHCFVSFYGRIIISWRSHLLFIHPSADGHCGCFHLLGIVNSAAVSTRVHMFEHLFSVLLGTYLRVESLGRMGILCLAVWGTTRLFSTAAEPFYVYTSGVWRFQFLHILINASYFTFLEELQPSWLVWSGNSSWFLLVFP